MPNCIVLDLFIIMVLRLRQTNITTASAFKRHNPEGRHLDTVEVTCMGRLRQLVDKRQLKARQRQQVLFAQRFTDSLRYQLTGSYSQPV